MATKLARFTHNGRQYERRVPVIFSLCIMADGEINRCSGNLRELRKQCPRLESMGYKDVKIVSIETGGEVK